MPLEATYSPAEVAAHLGCTRGTVYELLALGCEFGRELHPERGGLWGSFRTGIRCRRIPESAIERHKAHLARVESDPVFCARQLERAERGGLQVPAAHLESRLARMTRGAGLRVEVAA